MSHSVTTSPTDHRSLDQTICHVKRWCTNFEGQIFRGALCEDKYTEQEAPYFYEKYTGYLGILCVFLPGKLYVL